MKDKRVAKGDPSKSFFIDMLTKDIGLIDCILDLVDNSIDSLVRRYNLDVMDILKGTFDTNVRETVKQAKISVKITSDKFQIEDNCGGITINEAEDFVFRFGSPKNKKGKEAIC